MKSHLALVTAASVAFAAVLGAGPASAGSSVTVHGYFTDPLHLLVSATRCADLYDTPPLGPVLRNFSRSDPDLGAASWLITDPTAGEAPAVILDIASYDADPLAALRVRVPTSDTAVARLLYRPTVTPTLFWEGKAAVTLSAGWQTFDFAAPSTYIWTQRNLATHAATGPTAGPSSAADFALNHGDGAVEAIFTAGCSTPGTQVSFDSLQLGHTNAVTTYDLEAFVATVAPSPSAAITLGQAATLSSTLTLDVGDANGNPNPTAAGNFGLTLEQLSGAAWIPVASPTTTTGTVSTSVSPSSTTTYRWHSLASGSSDDAVSAPFTVSVKPPITAERLTASGPRKVTVGKKVKVKGSIVPAEPGAIVTLFAQGKGAPKRLGTGVVTTSGSFTVAFKAKRTGTLTLYVSAPAVGNSAAATSDRFKLKVKRRPS